MLFRQFIDSETASYTYLLADEDSREALIIDPVKDHLPRYLQIVQELDLRLLWALETHIHADHITAAGDLRLATGCQTGLGQPASSVCASRYFADGEVFVFGRYQLTALYTPGHTDDSYCFYLHDDSRSFLFSGDTLLIRGTGRTDFQNGNALQQYDSLQRVLALPESTLVYPAHDYKGWTSSTIGEEKRHNPRLQVKDAAAYAALMADLKLANPRFMDIAVPANRACGQIAGR